MKDVCECESVYLIKKEENNPQTITPMITRKKDRKNRTKNTLEFCTTVQSPRGQPQSRSGGPLCRLVWADPKSSSFFRIPTRLHISSTPPMGHDGMWSFVCFSFSKKNVD